jgi:hypothetical protein
MNKLTTLQLAHGRAVFPQHRQVAAVADSCIAPISASRGCLPRGLVCAWRRNPETGRLECAWSPVSQQDRCIAWRPKRLIPLASWALLKLVA